MCWEQMLIITIYSSWSSMSSQPPHVGCYLNDVDESNMLFIEKVFFFQVVARFVWRIIIDDISINRQWEVRMGVQKTITENPLHSSLCYIPLWSLFSLHTMLVISFTTGLKRCNSCLKTMTVHLKTAHMGWLHVWPHPNMPLHRCQAPILVLHTLLVCEIGEGKRNCSTQFLRKVSTT